MVGRRKEGSRIGKTLDALLMKGIDCIKIMPSVRPFGEILYLGLGRDEWGKSYSFEQLFDICSSIETDYMAIEPHRMTGKDIKEERRREGMDSIPKYKGDAKHYVALKLNDTEDYNVVGIRYVPREVPDKALRKALY